MRWYVLQVMTGRETAIKEKLIESLSGVHALAPRRIITERRRGTLTEVIRVLFPSYIFVQIKLDEINYYTVKELPGVFGFLGAQGPEPVPDEQMANVLRWCGGDELVGLSRVELGKQIRVIDGPLKGMEGRIIRIDKRKGRAKVRLTLFREEKEIDLGIEVIQASE